MSMPRTGAYAMLLKYVLSAVVVLVNLTPSARALDFWIVDPFSEDPVLPDTDLGGAEKRPTLRVTAAPGEFEAASFVVRSHTAVESLSFQVTDLTQQSKALPATSIDIKYVKAWYQGESAWRGVRVGRPEVKVLVPELLLNNSDLIKVDRQERKNYLLVQEGQDRTYQDISNGAVTDSNHIQLERFVVRDSETLLPISLAADENQQILLTVHVPNSTAPGEYTGELLVESPKTGTTALPMVVRVLPFTLPHGVLTYGIYYRGQLKPGDRTISSELKDEHQLRAELQNIRDHGVEYPTVFQGNHTPASQGILEELRSPQLLSDYLVVRAAAGFPKDRLFYVGRGTGNASDPSALSQLRSFVRSVKKVAGSHGFQDVFFYGLDEASGEELLSQKASWSAVHDEGGKVFAANNRHDIIRMAQLVDVAILAREVPREKIADLKSHNVLTLNYNNPQSAMENPYLFRRNYGLALWASGFDGAMIYAYQHGFGSIWDDTDHERFRDHCLTYPTTDGVINTLAWEGFREGIDDVRYLFRLLEELSFAATDQRPDVSILRNEADMLVRRLKDGRSWEPGEIRDEIIRIVVALREFRQLSARPSSPTDLQVPDH